MPSKENNPKKNIKCKKTMKTLKYLRKYLQVKKCFQVKISSSKYILKLKIHLSKNTFTENYRL